MRRAGREASCSPMDIFMWNGTEGSEHFFANDMEKNFVLDDDGSRERR